MININIILMVIAVLLIAILILLVVILKKISKMNIKQVLEANMQMIKDHGIALTVGKNRMEQIGDTMEFMKDEFIEALKEMDHKMFPEKYKKIDDEEKEAKKKKYDKPKKGRYQ